MDNTPSTIETFSDQWQRAIAPPEPWPINGQKIDFHELRDNLKPKARDT